MKRQPWVPLFAAASPTLLLLARLVWHPEDVPAAAALVDETQLPPRVRELFELLTAEDRDADVRALRVHMRSAHPDLFPALDSACTVPAALYDAVTIGELATAIAVPPADEPDRELGERFPALARWRDQVLSKKAGRRPLEIAAAWEFTALESERGGRTREAAKARRAAKSAVLQKRSA